MALWLMAAMALRIVLLKIIGICSGVALSGLRNPSPYCRVVTAAKKGIAGQQRLPYLVVERDRDSKSAASTIPCG